MASLRAPRVAVIIPINGWELHSRRAIESFSRTWGGAASVIVPASEGGDVDPAVQRLLRRYDPDYVATPLFSLGDFEAMHPGRSPLNVDGNGVPPNERAAFIERAEANGLRFMGPVVEDDVLGEIAACLPCFKDGDGHARASMTPDEVWPLTFTDSWPSPPTITTARVPCPMSHVPEDGRP